MALWLMGNDNKVSKLQLDDSGEYYMARVSDATDFSDAILYRRCCRLNSIPSIGYSRLYAINNRRNKTLDCIPYSCYS